MNRPEDRIPQDQTQEVFTLAAQLYAQHSQSYSVQELMAAGNEANIPPEFVQKAIAQIQLQRSSTVQPVPTPQSKRSKVLLISLAAGLLAMSALYFLARNGQVKEASVEAVKPIPTQPKVNETTQGASNFKCARLNLEGQDLSGDDLRGADCTEAKLTGANLSKSILEGANLSRSDLKNANLRGADIRKGDLAGADLAGADLSGANLEGANLSNTNLENANLSNANLTGADLTGAKKLDTANLKGTKK